MYQSDPYKSSGRNSANIMYRIVFRVCSGFQRTGEALQMCRKKTMYIYNIIYIYTVEPTNKSDDHKVGRMRNVICLPCCFSRISCMHRYSTMRNNSRCILYIYTIYVHTYIAYRLTVCMCIYIKKKYIYI